jgi:hypothetical protein
MIETTPASLQPHQRTSKKAGGVWLPGAASLLSSNKKEVSQNQKRSNTYRQQCVRAGVEPWNTI